jgi:CRP-like cAMP-binding protein
LKHGETLFKEGDNLESIYFIKEGGIEYSCLKEESLTEKQER